MEIYERPKVKKWINKDILSRFLRNPTKKISRKRSKNYYSNFLNKRPANLNIMKKSLLEDLMQGSIENYIKESIFHEPNTKVYRTILEKLRYDQS